MIRKILNSLLVLGLLSSSFLALVTPVQAADPQKESLLSTKTETKELLNYGEKRLSPTTSTQLTSSILNTKTGKTTNTYTATITGLPETLKDLKTQITCEWLFSRGADGRSYYQTGNNLFSAKATGNRLTVEYEGRSTAWDPAVWVGGAQLGLLSGPEVVPDPLNPNYLANTIKWVYTGQLSILSDPVTITRYARQIEGALLEYFILTKDPGAQVLIKQNTKTEAGFVGQKPVEAWDADGRPVRVSGISTSKVVAAADLAQAKYPVTIDPTTSFTTSASDGFAYTGVSPYTWAHLWGAPYEAGWPGAYTSAPYLHVGVSSNGGNGYLERAFVYFDTSSIGSGSTITSSTFSFYSYTYVYQHTAWNLTLQSGMPTYPHDPLVGDDSLPTYYTGNLGQIGSASITSGYNTITLNTSGLSAINKEGSTKLALREYEHDILNIDPVPVPPNGQYRNITFYSYEQGAGYQPKLTVTYTVTVVTPTVTTTDATGTTETSSTLGGTLTADGGASSSTRVEYGTVTATYTGSTAWVAGYTTGQSWSPTVSGLSKGTLYYYRANAVNSAGQGNGAEKTFLTQPGVPTAFTATPGDVKNNLAWTKGTGSTNTIIRRSTTGYPTSITDGTSVYTGAGASVSDTPLTNGTTYYYSAWGQTINGALTTYSPTYVSCSGIPTFTGAPTMTSYDATAVGVAIATLNGNLDALNNGTPVTASFQYGLTNAYGTETTTTSMAATGPYSKDIVGLAASTLYYFRAKGVNANGTAYGSGKTFTTGAVSAPTMTSNAATGVTKTEGTMHGTVTDSGGALCTVWFQYGLTNVYGSTSATSSGLDTTDTFYYSLSSLAPGTTYHFRAVGQNSAGTGYGADQTIVTTSPTTPVLVTSDATSVGASSGSLNGSLTDDGGVTCSVYFEWDFDAPGAPYANSTGLQPGYTSGTTFNQYLPDLTAGTTYYFRAVATNSGGTGYGGEKSFTCAFGPPSSFGATPTSTSSITLSWTPIGDQTAIFAKQGSFPVDRLDGDQIYMGTAQTTSYGGLIPGTSYFFRTWSWKTGGTWSAAYAEDVATTPASTTASNPTLPQIIDPTGVTAPTTYWTDPNTTFVATLPIYPMTQYVSTGTGIPIATIWVWIGVGIVLLVLVAFSITKTPIIIAGAGLLVISTLSIMGLFPMLVFYASILMGIPVLWVLSKN